VRGAPVGLPSFVLQRARGHEFSGRRLGRLARAGRHSPLAAQADFYRGKTIDLVSRPAVGGGLDANARVVRAPSGETTFQASRRSCPRNSRAPPYPAPRELRVQQAPEDGTVIANLSSRSSVLAAGASNGSKGIQVFDLLKFQLAALDLSSIRRVYVVVRHNRADLGRGTVARTARC